jgi:mannitol/fructose-specific phosphotransferase system IIA component (Ntr-type)
MKTFENILKLERIRDLTSEKKADVLEEMCSMVADAPEVTSIEALKKAIRAREAIMSTGIGMGIAIPHAKIASVQDFVMAVGRSKGGVDFQALDSAPVNVVILIVASDTQGDDFLKVLSKIGKFFINPLNRDKILEASGTEEIYRLFTNIDEQ